MLHTIHEISFVLDDEIWEAFAFGNFLFLHGTVCDDTQFAVFFMFLCLLLIALI